MSELVDSDIDFNSYFAQVSSPQASLGFEEKKFAMDLLARKISTCTACQELAQRRNNTVPGTGHLEPDICFIGEAPGADEDLQGKPFVGRAGQLLDRILRACGLSREEVYIANILKCRPPNNRNPEPLEIKNCSPYLVKQLQVLKPKVICALGAVAARRLLQTEESITSLRGRFHSYHDIPLLCTYHPAYLLRNPVKKRDVWGDMQILMKFIGRPIIKAKK